VSGPFGAARQVEDAALAEILDYLAARHYVFVAPTPSTHRLVRERGGAAQDDHLRDIFGWTRPFSADAIDPDLLAMAQRAGIIEQEGDLLRLTVRVSAVDGRLYLHSAPTQSSEAVFLGPDSYRYARFLRQTLSQGSRVRQALDIGAGTGVGALTLAAQCPEAAVTATDINPEALRLCRINATHNRLGLALIECSGLPAEPPRFDVIAANPPYVAGKATRLYRDGGGALGAGLALDWVESGLARLTSGGRFLLYTGSAIVRGEDLIRNALERLADGRFALEYEEIDPDVFGGMLRQKAYRDVERIAAVGAVLTAP
jgi:methylase of polypeptide subunit release factors